MSDRHEAVNWSIGCLEPIAAISEFAWQSCGRRRAATGCAVTLNLYQLEGCPARRRGVPQTLRRERRTLHQQGAAASRQAQPFGVRRSASVAEHDEPLRVRRSTAVRSVQDLHLQVVPGGHRKRATGRARHRTCRYRASQDADTGCVIGDYRVVEAGRSRRCIGGCLEVCQHRTTRQRPEQRVANQAPNVGVGRDGARASPELRNIDPAVCNTASTWYGGVAGELDGRGRGDRAAGST